MVFEFSSIIFPSPKPSYTEQYFNNPKEDDDFYKYDEKDSIIFIHSNKFDNKNKKHYVPCTFLPYFDYLNYTNKNFLIYLHGNAEDIGLAYDFASVLRDNFQMNVICMEYPGYGIYKNEKYEPSEEQICCDADNLLKYVKTLTNEQNIFLFGRSMGTGSATYLASKNEKLGGLILMSAYTNIRAVADGLVSKALSWLVKDRFRNIDNIQNIQCPVLLIHGRDDSLINYNHSKQLYEKIPEFIKKNKQVLTHFPESMTHNDFNTQNDIVEPLTMFFTNVVNLKASINKDNYENLKTDFSKFKIPQFIKFNTKPIQKQKLISQQININNNSNNNNTFLQQQQAFQQQCQYSQNQVNITTQQQNHDVKEKYPLQTKQIIQIKQTEQQLQQQKQHYMPITDLNANENFVQQYQQ